MAKNTIYNSFKNPFTYAAGIEKWCKDFYYNTSGNELQYTFCADFAIADWLSEDAVRDTFWKAIKSWGDDYEAFTEIVLAINLLSWANDQLVKQGIADREKWVDFYSELYYDAKDEFYMRFDGNDEATKYFFNMTD
jgi:hypothetical protein